MSPIQRKEEIDIAIKRGPADVEERKWLRTGELWEYHRPGLTASDKSPGETQAELVGRRARTNSSARASKSRGSKKTAVTSTRSSTRKSNAKKRRSAERAIEHKGLDPKKDAIPSWENRRIESEERFAAMDALLGIKVRNYKTFFQIDAAHEPDSEPEAEEDQGKRKEVIDAMVEQMEKFSCPPDMAAASPPSACCHGEPGGGGEAESSMEAVQAVEPPPEPAAPPPSACRYGVPGGRSSWHRGRPARTHQPT
jgi:hypothetical protein